MITASAYLKKHTLAAHKATEQAMDSHRILKANLQLDDYRDIITANYVVWSFFDRQFATFQEHKTTPGLQKHLLFGSSFLQKDLKLLNVQLPPEYLLHETTSTPSQQTIVSNLESALGAIYVLRGSTLGGKYIYQALKRNKHLSKIPYFHFYQYCNDIPAEQWPQFQAFLNEQLLGSQQLQTASEAALAVFSYFQETYKKLRFTT